MNLSASALPAENLPDNSISHVETGQFAEERVEIERRYRHISEEAGDIIYRTTPSGRFSFVNTTFERVLGYTAEEARRLRYTDVIALGYRDAAAEFYANQFRDKVANTFYELPVVARDGSRVWLNQNVQIIYDGERMIGFQAVARDNTGRKQIEDRLRDSEARYRRIAANVPGMVYQFVLRADSSVSFLFVSDGCRELYGVAPEEITRDANVALDLLHTEDRPGFEASVAESARTLQAWRWEGRTYDCAGNLKWIQGASRPEQQPDGTIIWDGLVLDITDRKLAEERLRESAGQLRVVAESASDAIITIDVKSTILFVNPAVERIFGYAPAEMIGEKLYMLIPEHLRARHAAGMSRYLASGARSIPWSGVEVPACHKDGHEVQVEISFGEFAEDGERMFTAVLRDITERKRAADELRRSEQYRDLFRHANDAILIFDPDGEIVLEVNDKACKVYGYERDGFIGRSIKEMSHDVERGEQQLENLLRAGDYNEFETLQTRADGTPAHFLINSSVIEYEGRTAVLSINRDITERKRAEEKIKESEEWLKAIFDASRDGILVEYDEHIFYVNASYARLFGYDTTEELTGLHVSAVVSAEDEERMVEYGRLRARGEMPPSVYEFNGRKKDGTTIEVEASVSTSTVAGKQYITTAIRDITERRAAEAALRERDERFRGFMNNSPAVAFMKNEEGCYAYINETHERTFGVKSDYLLGRTDEAWLPADVARQMRDNDRRVLAENETIELLEVVPTPDGARREWMTFKFPFSDAAGRRYVGGVAVDVTERRRAEEQLRHDAFHDRLTNLPNRALFLEHLRLRIERNHTAARAGGGRRSATSFAVLFLDFDRFKVVNDSLGHMEGDKLLVMIARRLGSSLRPGDSVARLGGDEFTILLDELDDPSDALRVAERIQDDLRQPFDLDGREVFTSASIGIAFSECHYTKPEDMIRDADAAMYRAKARGRARYEVFGQEMHRHAVARLQIETEMRRALDRHEFRVFYQPIVDLTSTAIVGFESLVRWQHPERGLIPPGEFIPVAEETGLIARLGSFVLGESCAQMRRWLNSIPNNDNLTISVNVSAKQFAGTRFADEVAEVLRESGLDPHHLKLELTESLLMENSEAAVRTLDRLRSLNIEISIDDFGTGYSSLSYLHRLPLDNLKIDRSFVSRMVEAAENVEIVRTIIALARNLGLKTIAEGVETESQLELLKKLGCDYAQGYLFGRPVPAEETIERIERPSPHAHEFTRAALRELDLVG